MMTPTQQSQLSLLQQQLLQNQQEQNALQNIGGLIGNALAKRNDGVNDNLGNGNRYTNDTPNGGAFNEQQLASLNQFVNNNMDTAQKYSDLANQKFTINGSQYVADKDGTLTKITNFQANSGPLSQSVSNTPMNINLQQGVAGQGLTSFIPGYTDNPVAGNNVSSDTISYRPEGAAAIDLPTLGISTNNFIQEITQKKKEGE